MLLFCSKWLLEKWLLVEMVVGCWKEKEFFSLPLTINH